MVNEILIAILTVGFCVMLLYVRYIKHRFEIAWGMAHSYIKVMLVHVTCMDYKNGKFTDNEFQTLCEKMISSMSEWEKKEADTLIKMYGVDNK